MIKLFSYQTQLHRKNGVTLTLILHGRLNNVELSPQKQMFFFLFSQWKGLPTNISNKILQNKEIFTYHFSVQNIAPLFKGTAEDEWNNLYLQKLKSSVSQTFWALLSNNNFALLILWYLRGAVNLHTSLNCRI